MKKQIEIIIKRIFSSFGLDPIMGLSFCSVETGGDGFHPVTGKIIIQFEPAWFRKKSPYSPSGLWSLNGVERQEQEWKAFNDAFSKNPTAAMESTSIGIGQIMGSHWKRLGYSSVGAMWDDAKKGIDRQVWQICKFIETDPELKEAIIEKNFYKIAYIYNGSGFIKLAKKYNRERYDKSMENAYNKYLNKNE